MKKKILWTAALILLPVAAMMVANLPNSVTYLYPDASKAQTMSYFGLNEDVKAAACLPAAGLVIGLCICFAVAYAISRKGYWLKAVSGPSFAAALLAVVPYLMPNEIRVVPNVIVPIAMMLEWLLAHQMGKAAENETRALEKGRRLEKR